jgi:hypothetical protein
MKLHYKVQEEIFADSRTKTDVRVRRRSGKANLPASPGKYQQLGYLRFPRIQSSRDITNKYDVT